MNKPFVLFGMLSLAVFAAPSVAASQQDKMRGCHMEASAQKLTADAKKGFLKKCLKKDYQLKAATVDKINRCKAETKKQNLAEDKQKSYMRSCIKT